MLDKAAVLERVRDDWMPAFRKEREHLDRIDRWYRWEHDKPHAPRQATPEYNELAARSQTPWLSLVVTTLAQSLYVEGFRRPKDKDNSPAWGYWQANGMDRRQIPLHRAALAYGLAYETVLPGTTHLGEKIPVLRGVSPRRMITFYEDPANDDWPLYALQADPVKINGSMGWSLRVYDDEAIWYLQCEGDGGGLTYIEYREHDVGVCPVVRFANMLDLEGRAPGEVEPFIPIAGRINQTIFDRLVVQRFASWVVRTVAGMSPPDKLPDGMTEMQWRAQQAKLLRVEDFLAADDPDTKFGTLDATPLEGFIKAKEADVQDLAAVSQTPPHHLLGTIINISAEALAAAEASLSRKRTEREHSFGESHEQSLRLASHIMGDADGARDMDAQVRWRDIESRSLNQAADALGKFATMLGVPVEMLWEKIPGWTDQDVARAKELATEAGGIDQLLRKLTEEQHPPAGG